MIQRIYSGVRDQGRAIVTVDGHRLAPRFDLRNHSPDGFEWGYQGSGPAQLALAILVDHLLVAGIPPNAPPWLGPVDLALRMYQQFKSEVVAELRGDTWTMNTTHVATWLVRTEINP
jgi:hypothetical protein